MTTPQHTSASVLDVLIIGAGPAGCATALALRQAGVEHVALLDQPARLRWRMSETAAPDVPALLARCGLAMPGRHRPYLGGASLWGGPLLVDDFARSRRTPGYLLDRQYFDEQLQSAVRAAGIALYQPARLLQAEYARGIWQVQWQQSGDGERHLGQTRARLLVDASGRRARLASHVLGVPRLRVDDQVALALRVPSECLTPEAAFLQGRVLVAADPAGWWYLSQLSDGQLLLSLMTDQDLARELRHVARWPQRLAALEGLASYFDLTALSRYLSTNDVTTSESAAGESRALQSFAAHSVCLARAAGPGWLALGDALISLDPLTASGLSMALQDAHQATREVLLPWLAGAELALSGRAWGEQANRRWMDYLQARQQRYGEVQLWPDAPFWQRRQRALPNAERVRQL